MFFSSFSYELSSFSSEMISLCFPALKTSGIVAVENLKAYKLYLKYTKNINKNLQKTHCKITWKPVDEIAAARDPFSYSSCTGSSFPTSA